jgi:2-phosphosulfolactate phosphatase
MDITKATLDDCKDLKNTIVAIDVLRAFTTSAFAFAAGAESIYLVSSIEEAFELKEVMPQALLMGEQDEIMVPGFDYGNSPADLVGVDFRGKHLIQRTTAGTQGIVKCPHAADWFAASFCCASATATALRSKGVGSVSFVETGTLRDWGGDEDTACADYIAALLTGQQPDPGPYLDRVLNCAGAEKFKNPDVPEFNPEDLELSMALDIFEFAMHVERRGDLWVMFPVDPLNPDE